MKKLIGIFAMLLITLSVLGQSSGVYNMISNQPEYLNVLTFTPTKLNDYLNEVSKTPKDYEKLFSFKANDRFYVVSYDVTSIDYTKVATDCVKRRDVWLFAWDGKSWSKAIHTPLQTDSIWYTADGWFHDIYYPLRHDEMAGNYGDIVVEDNGIVNIFFLSHTINRSITNRSTFYRKQFILRPHNDGMYHVEVRAKLL